MEGVDVDSSSERTTPRLRDIVGIWKGSTRRKTRLNEVYGSLCSVTFSGRAKFMLALHFVTSSRGRPNQILHCGQIKKG